MQLVSNKNPTITASPTPSTSTALPNDVEPISDSVKSLNANDFQCYNSAKKNIEELALYLKPSSCGTTASLLSRPMQRKLVTLVNCQLVEEEGRSRAIRAARSLGERTVTELILQHQNPQQLSANLWAAVRARGCQFLGPAMQEDVLKLVLLALEDGSALSRKVLVMFVVQRLEPHFPQASKTSIGHVVQLLYRASCFKVSKRESDSSLMQLKEEFRTYDALRREHDAQIVQIATEAGLRIAPDQWSALLYGDTSHKSHMQSIIDKLQTPQSFAQSVQELVIALQRTNDPSNLAGLRTYLKQLTSIDPTSENSAPAWNELAESLDAVKQVVTGLVDFVQQHGNRKLQDSTHNNHPTKYKISMCRDLTMRAVCPRGSNCTFAHSEEELEKYRTRNRKLHARTPTSNSISNRDAVEYLNDHSLSATHLYVPSLSNKTSPMKEQSMPPQSNIQSQYDQTKPAKFQPINPCPITKSLPPQGMSFNIMSGNAGNGKPNHAISQQNLNLLAPGHLPTPMGYQNNSKTPTPGQGHPAGKYNNEMYSPGYAKTPSPHLHSPRMANQKAKHFKYQSEQTSPRNYGHRHVNDLNHQNSGWNQHQRQMIGNSQPPNISKTYFPHPQQASLPNSPNPYGGQQPSAMVMLQNLELRKQEILKQLEKSNNFNGANQSPNLFNNKMSNNNYVNNIGNNQLQNNQKGGHPVLGAYKDYWNQIVPSNANQTQQQQAIFDSNMEHLALNEVAHTQTKDDIFVRSDSILTDDDYVPFDTPTQSKFGPISRMPIKPMNQHGQQQQQFDNQFPINDPLHFSTAAPSTNPANSNSMLTSSVNSDISMWLYGNIPKTKSASVGLYPTMANKEQKDHFLDAVAVPSTDTPSSSSLSTVSNNSIADAKFQFRPTTNGRVGDNTKHLELNMFEAVPNETEQNVLNMELKLIDQKLMDNNNSGNLNKVSLTIHTDLIIIIL